MPKPNNQTEPDNAQRRLMVFIIQIVCLAVAILVYLYFTAQSWTVVCTKDDAGMINCSVRKTVLGILTLQETTVTGMAAAATKEQCEGTSCKYRLELYDNQGDAHPVEEQYTQGDIVKDKVAKLLNDFVIQPDKQEIKLREGGDWLVFMLPITAIIAFIIYRASLMKPK
jgi:hypothetical protein